MIDIIIPWVDGADAEWRKSKAAYSPGTAAMNGGNRFRDMNAMRYWFRAVEKYAPWVNKIFFVTAGHLPDFLNLSHPKLVRVKHSDYIPAEFLPTFNSNAIELNFHRIESLSERFILFNDDTFLNRPTTPEDFFADGLPRALGVLNATSPYNDFMYIQFNNTYVINRHFKQRENQKHYFSPKYGKELARNLFFRNYPVYPGFLEKHIVIPHLKSVWNEVWEREGAVLSETSGNKFRTRADVSHLLFKNWYVASGRFAPQSAGFGRYYNLSDYRQYKPDIANAKSKVVCVNDESPDANFELDLGGLLSLLDKKFPEKSSFEL
ncbi:exopolysaccharide phosphotransferase cps2G [Clostridia bacterium]|nr:exopolysaccharide phosphotransferase cps2G [Clostridia bacterium]